MELLYISAVTLLAVKYFSPLEPVRQWIVTKLVRLMLKPRFGWVDKVITLITCSMCVSFWSTLLITHSLGKAAVVAILTRIIDLTIEYLQYGNK